MPVFTFKLEGSTEPHVLPLASLVVCPSSPPLIESAPGFDDRWRRTTVQ